MPFAKSRKINEEANHILFGMNVFSKRLISVFLSLGSFNYSLLTNKINTKKKKFSKLHEGNFKIQKFRGLSALSVLRVKIFLSPFPLLLPGFLVKRVTAAEEGLKVRRCTAARERTARSERIWP